MCVRGINSTCFFYFSFNGWDIVVYIFFLLSRLKFDLVFNIRTLFIKLSCICQTSVPCIYTMVHMIYKYKTLKNIYYNYLQAYQSNTEQSFSKAISYAYMIFIILHHTYQTNIHYINNTQIVYTYHSTELFT